MVWRYRNCTSRVWAAFLTACLESEKKTNAVGDMLAIGPASDRGIRK